MKLIILVRNLFFALCWIVAALLPVLKCRAQSVEQQIVELRKEMESQGIKTKRAEFNIITDAETRKRADAIDAFAKLPDWGVSQAINFCPFSSNGTVKIIWRQQWVPWIPMPGEETDEFGKKIQAFQWTDMRSRIEPYRAGLAQVCDTVKSGSIRFEEELDNPNREPVNRPMPGGYRTLDFSDLAEKAGAGIMCDLHDGKPAEAWTNLYTVTHIFTAWEPGPFKIDQFGRPEVMRDIFWINWQALQFTNWTDDQLALLTKEWKPIDFFNQLPDLATFELLSSVPSGKYWSLWKWEEADMAWQHEKDAWLHVQSVTMETRRVIHLPNWITIRRLIGKANSIPLIIGTFPEVNMERLFASAAEAETEKRILIAAISLERYRGRHGNYPNSMDALVPEFLESVPLDFMDGKPLRYHLTGDGHFVLYSVGLDCVDHGNELNVDIVWPRPSPQLGSVPVDAVGKRVRPTKISSKLSPFHVTSGGTIHQQ